MKNKILSLFLIFVLCCLSGCYGNKNVKDYISSTDFGDSIALVGDIEFGAFKMDDNPYKCIDTKGNHLFDLPNDLICGSCDYDSTEYVSPVNDYIFATDRENWHKTRYVLDKNGKIIISPEIQNYDYLYIPKYYKMMFEDGYILVTKVEKTYNTTTYLLGVLDFNGKWILNMGEYPYSDRYVGNGLLSNGLNLKTGEFDKYFNYSDYSMLNSAKKSSYSVELTSHLLPELYDKLEEDRKFDDGTLTGYTYEDKAVLLFGNEPEYISIINFQNEWVVEPFVPKDFDSDEKTVLLFDTGFIIAPNNFNSNKSEEITIYDYNGKQKSSILLEGDDYGPKWEVHPFSAGFFRIEHGGELFNYMNVSGDFLF